MTPDERKAAGERRKRAAVEQGGPGVRALRSQVPCAFGQWQMRAADLARSVPFKAELRAKLEKRGSQQLYHLTGIASVTDTPYEMWDWAGPYEEIVARVAFTATLGNNPDVAFLVNHRGVTMARTTNGTLELRMVEEGLQQDAWLNPKRQDVSDLVVAVDDENIDQMSFAFMLEEGTWNEDFTSFTITRLDLHRGDVSAVNYGANPYTSISARSRDVLSDLDHLPTGAARAAYAQLGRREDVDTDNPLTPAPSQAAAREPASPQSDSGAEKAHLSTVAKYEALLAEDD